MSENNTSTLRKMSRAELLEMLVEQRKIADAAVADKEAAEAELAEKNETLERLKAKLDEKDAYIDEYTKETQIKLQKYSRRIKSLKESLEAERMIRLHSLSEARTISEASRYMDQLLEDTRVANSMYQRLIRRISEEAKKHE